MKYVRVAEMQAIEREADAKGISYSMMMENAGLGLAEAVMDTYGYLDEDGALGLVGSGNNGGDTLVALEILAKEGWKTSAYILRPRSDADPLVERLIQAGGAVIHAAQDPERKQLFALLESCGVVLDGILGTGFRLPLQGELAEAMTAVKHKLAQMPEAPFVVAVDCPSGVDCDTGAAAPECLPAHLTVTMAAIKQGLFKFPAYNLIGEYHVVGIGLPEGERALEAEKAVTCSVVDLDWVRDVLPKRPVDAHKGTFGTALVAAGSVNYTGAAHLAGEAAYRAGAGLVTLAVPAPLHAALAGQFPEATWLLLPHEMGVIAADAAQVIFENLSKATALLVGPGFGMEETTGEFLRKLLSGAPKQKQATMGFVRSSQQPVSSESAKLPPLVLDADGLKLLAAMPDWPARLPELSILTPHPGEMSVLTGLSTSEIQAERLDIARRCSREWGQVVVLKGAFTVIAEPGGQAAIIPVASPALARAGSGDVLAGIITGLRAQGMPAFEAAAAGAWIHAQAGLLAAYDLGSSAAVLAGDILAQTVHVMADLSC